MIDLSTSIIVVLTTLFFFTSILIIGMGCGATLDCTQAMTPLNRMFWKCVGFSLTFSAATAFFFFGLQMIGVGSSS